MKLSLKFPPNHRVRLIMPPTVTANMTPFIDVINNTTGTVKISADPYNRLKWGTDGGLFVSDKFDPDPLAYYILAKN